MRRRSLSSSRPNRRAGDANLCVGIDLELVAQRILKLAEISTLEHLTSVERSQAAQLEDVHAALQDEVAPFIGVAALIGQPERMDAPAPPPQAAT